MKTILIETAANGYIARDEAQSFGMGMMRIPHVFETFEALTLWLSQQLEKPSSPNGQAVKGDVANA